MSDVPVVVNLVMPLQYCLALAEEPQALYCLLCKHNKFDEELEAQKAEDAALEAAGKTLSADAAAARAAREKERQSIMADTYKCVKTQLLMTSDAFGVFYRRVVLLLFADACTVH